MPPSVPLHLRWKRYLVILVAALVSTLFYANRVNFYVLPHGMDKNEAAAHGSEDLTIYKLPDTFTEEPIHLTPIDPTILIELGNESIDAAHRKGELHIGSLLYILDAQGRILLTKRSSSVVTCPDTWLLIGEHAIVGEDANDIPLRAMEEELGVSVTADQHVKIQNLTEFPLYYVRRYGARNGNRIDRQLTYLWFVKFPKREEDIGWKLDNEAADHKWITLQEMDSWLKEDEKNDDQINLSNTDDDGPSNGDFCHWTIRSILRVGVDRLKEILSTSNQIQQ